MAIERRARKVSAVSAVSVEGDEAERSSEGRLRRARRRPYSTKGQDQGGVEETGRWSWEVEVMSSLTSGFVAWSLLLRFIHDCRVG